MRPHVAGDLGLRIRLARGFKATCPVMLGSLLCAYSQVAAAPSGPPATPLGLRSGVELASIFAREVRPRLDVPQEEHAVYAGLLGAALTNANVVLTTAQYVLLVDRSPKVQAVLVLWADGEGQLLVVGGSPVSTGRPGAYEHFLTPLGVFNQSIEHLDFRAEGTRNQFGVRGYGVKGMRVFDFGWVIGERTWGHGGLSPMRLQLHATDPDLLEPRLGSAASSGCIRISASLNQFLDKYGLLDANYEAAMEGGVQFWVLRKDRTPTPWSSRYLVVVESERTQRPAWTPLPLSDRKAEKSSLSPACEVIRVR
jgi:hypothetical protein